MDRRLDSGSAHGSAATLIVGLIQSGWPGEQISRGKRENFRPTVRYSDVRLDEAKRWILSHVDDPALGVDGLAKALHISRRALYLLFSAHGLTPAAVIRDLRLASCKEALEDPCSGRHITAIAIDHGFHHLATFGRLFKARYGMCPNAYRKQMIEARGDGTSIPTASSLPSATVYSTGHANMDLSEDQDSSEPASLDPLPRGRLIEPLTLRELQILGLVCDGYSNQEISSLVHIRLQTVKYHVMNIFGKLGVRRRTQVVAVAVHLRLVNPRWLHMDFWNGSERLIAKERTQAVPRLADNRTRNVQLA